METMLYRKPTDHHAAQFVWTHFRLEYSNEMALIVPVRVQKGDGESILVLLGSQQLLIPFIV